jgi:hypothetical protein
MPNRRMAKLAPLIGLLDSLAPDVVLLQECRAGWCESVCDGLGMAGLWSHDLLDGVAGLPADGTAIGLRRPFRIDRAQTLVDADFDPTLILELDDCERRESAAGVPAELLARYRARSLLVEISSGPGRFVAGSFHATPGTGRFGPKPGRRVGRYKPFFHGAVAAALSRLDVPFVFAIDANEPRAETPESVTFHRNGGSLGEAQVAALLGMSPVHRARDLLREHVKSTHASPISPEVLAVTYRTHNGGDAGRRRFDSIWATPEFRLADFSTLYEQAVTAGTDHALLIADLTPQ